MIAFTHKTHPRARHLKIKIEPSGEVVVVTPKFTPQILIKRFVKNNQDWIQRKLATLTQINGDASEIFIFGRRYTKKVLFSKHNPIGIRVVDDALILNPVTTSDSQAWTKAYDKKLASFLKSTAEQYIVPRTDQLASKMNITYGKVSLKQQKTRWGSCSSLGNLNFNWRLVHFAPHIIDYVIIHELAHRTHMNHSRDFWQLVERHDPEYRKSRGFLKRNGMKVG